MIDGTEIKLGETSFLCPPAPFACVRKYEDIFTGKSDASLNQMADILFTSLRRNYPELKQEEFEFQNLDIANFREAFRVCLSVNQPQETEPGEAVPGKP